VANRVGVVIGKGNCGSVLILKEVSHFWVTLELPRFFLIFSSFFLKLSMPLLRTTSPAYYTGFTTLHSGLLHLFTVT
jgi:hypothetical protein